MQNISAAAAVCVVKVSAATLVANAAIGRRRQTSPVDKLVNSGWGIGAHGAAGWSARGRSTHCTFCIVAAHLQVATAWMHIVQQMLTCCDHFRELHACSESVERISSHNHRSAQPPTLKCRLAQRLTATALIASMNRSCCCLLTNIITCARRDHTFRIHNGRCPDTVRSQMYNSQLSSISLHNHKFTQCKDEMHNSARLLSRCVECEEMSNYTS